MKMHGVRRLVHSVEDDADSLARAKVVNIPLWIGVREVAIICQQQDWLVVIRSLSSVVHDPHMLACAVGKEIHVNGFYRIWIWVQRLRKERNSLLQIILRK